MTCIDFLLIFGFSVLIYQEKQQIRSKRVTNERIKADSFVGKCILRATTFLGFSVSLYLHFHSFVIKG